MERTPEPKILSPYDEAAEYHAMDHEEVNRQFVDDLLAGPIGPQVTVGPQETVGPQIIDLGCGPAGIPIELCKRSQTFQVLAIDAEVEMLEIAKREIDVAGLLSQVTLNHASVDDMDCYEDGLADTVISNSLLHHLDKPSVGLTVAVRLIRSEGRVFIRDLARPSTASQIEDLVLRYCHDETANSQQLFRQSLHASLTLDEIREIARGLGISDQHVQMTSDRHWTIDWCGAP